MLLQAIQCTKCACSLPQASQPGIIQPAPRLAAPKSRLQYKLHTCAGTLPVGRDGDAFLLRQVLHDWSDKDVVKILRCCREALGSSKSKLLIVEVMCLPTDMHLMRPQS